MSVGGGGGLSRMNNYVSPNSIIAQINQALVYGNQKVICECLVNLLIAKLIFQKFNYGHGGGGARGAIELNV